MMIHQRVRHDADLILSTELKAFPEENLPRAEQSTLVCNSLATSSRSLCPGSGDLGTDQPLTSWAGRQFAEPMSLCSVIYRNELMTLCQDLQRQCMENPGPQACSGGSHVGGGRQ